MVVFTRRVRNRRDLTEPGLRKKTPLSVRTRFVGNATSKSEGHASRARSEGRACHARRARIDYQTLFGGPDKQVPPNFGGN